MKLKHLAAISLLAFLFAGSGCNSSDDNNNSSSDNNLTSSDISTQQTLSDNSSGGHALIVSGDTKSYSRLRITKTGDVSGEDADFYGSNSAVFATNSATLTLTDSIITTNGSHANAVFSYGQGTTINIADSVITTSSNNSGGIMTTGGGTMNASNLTVETSGGSSAPIRSDRGGGTVNVTGGSYTSSGKGSPAIYSTADITVQSAKLESKAAQGVVIEGKNSVKLQSSQLIADNNTHNSNNSTRYQAVMIYQSGSGDASEGKGSFSATGGSLTNANGDIFFVNNTTADITLENTDITNNDEEGVLLRAEAAGWGTEGSNGGKVNFYATDQTLDGDFVVDDISALNLYLADNTVFAGAVNTDNSDGEIYVEVENSQWTLLGNSYITSLTCSANSINLNGYSLYVSGNAYTEGTESSGSAISFTTNSDSNNSDSRPTPPDGNGPSDGGTPPDGNGPSDGGTPPDGNGPGGDSGSEDTGSNDTSMTFDSTNYTTGTVNSTSYRAYTNLVYVANPVNETYQRMNVYIPEAYFSGGTINGYSASSAPIFMPNGVGGYSRASAMTPSSSNSLGQALQNGLVVASPALRGKELDEGKAPACIVDYKAAVRYLRANKAKLPAGNTNRIISSGTSAGGAISALLGATGNSSDYDTWLNELGAANASDDIFAAMCYCPITNLDNADGAYEWMFGTGTTASNTLKAAFITYVNSLGLTDDGKAITLNSDGTGSFYDYVAEVLADSAEDAMDDGTSVSETWLTVSNGKVTAVDLAAYGSSRGKSAVPAFDTLDLSSAENTVFGDAHFTDYGYNNNTASSNARAEASVVKAMNPMNYIGSATTAKYWRIRHGTKDSDTSLAVPALLELKLENNGCEVDFEAAWGERHGGDYDLDELFEWIDDICK